MRYSIVVAAALFVLALSACERDKPTVVVTPSAPATVVAVPVPGPAGPQGVLVRLPKKVKPEQPAHPE